MVLARKRVMFMLLVMSYVVSYTLFRDWIGLVRFLGLSFDTFFIAVFYKLCDCDQWVFEFASLLIIACDCAAVRAGFESLCNDEVIDQCECASNLLFLHSLLILFFDDFWRRMQMFKPFWTGVLNDFGTLRLASSDTRRHLMPSSRLAPVDWHGLVGLTASLTLCCLHETMCSHWHVLLWKLLKMNWVYRI